MPSTHSILEYIPGGGPPPDGSGELPDRPHGRHNRIVWELMHLDQQTAARLQDVNSTDARRLSLSTATNDACNRERVSKRERRQRREEVEGIAFATQHPAIRRRCEAALASPDQVSSTATIIPFRPR